MKHRFVNVLASAALAAAAPALAQPTVKSGIEAWQRGDYAAAVSIWQPLAKKGDADAEFNLGQAYRLGRGVPVDLGQAQTWLEKAADSGHVDAQTTLGLLLFDSGNRAGAMRWLKKAAEQGEPRAMLVYGTALFNGDDVPKDPIMAYAYVSRAAAQGLQPAKDTLAQMDQILPADMRQKAIALAVQQGTTRSTPSPAKATSAAEPSSKPAPKPAQAKVQPRPTSKAAEAKQTPASAPEKKAAPAAPTKSAAASGASGSWRIQLGAFSHRGSAEALYHKLSGSAPVAGHQAFYVPAGNITRLQVGGFASRGSAEAACAALKGQGCFPVEGK